MRFALRVDQDGIVAAAWSGWARLACVALFGVWFQLHSPDAVSQALPAPTWTYCRLGALNESCEHYEANFDALITFSSGQCASHANSSFIGPSYSQADPREENYYCWDTVAFTTLETYRLRARPLCAGGWSYAGSNECVSETCSALAGSRKPFQVVAEDGGACSASPANVCFSDGCRGRVVNGGDCVGLPLASPPSSMYSGFAQVISSETCASSDSLASTSSTSGVAPSSGGVGVSTVGASSPDSINLARIATNTSRIAEGVLSGGSSGSGCGGVSQPPCKLDETGVAAEGSAAMSQQAAAETTMASALDSQASSLSLGSMPDFRGGSSSTRWTLTFLPFLAASGPSECKVEWDVPLVGQVFKAGYDFCSMADAVRQFLYWAFAVGTAVGIWNMVYRTRGGE